MTLKALAGLLNLFVVLSLTLFLSAWSLDFWEAWACLAAFFGPVVFITCYFLMKDPELIGRRLKAGPAGEMYSGALILVLVTPLALGSWAGLPFACLLVSVILLRLLPGIW